MSRQQTIYRPPQAQVGDARAKLEKYESNFRTRAIVLFLLGVLVTLIAPALIAAILRMREMLRPRLEQHSFLHHFLIVSFFAVPIMLILARLIRGGMADRAAESVDVRGMPIAMPAVGRLFVGLAIIDIALWGPRMVLLGATRFFSHHKHKNADRSIAAKIMGVLLTRNEGLRLEELMPLVAAPVDPFADALALLTFLEITDVSKEGDRVWLQSLARQQLGKL